MVTSGEKQRSGDSSRGEGELKGLRVVIPQGQSQVWEVERFGE